MLQRLRGYATTTNILILVIVISFIIQILVEEYTDAFKFSIEYIIFEPYRFFTSGFLHGSILHLFLNMYALFIFGNLLEKEAGNKQMLVLFLLGSLAGTGGHILLGVLGVEPIKTLIGASDSISAIFGACVFLALYRNIEVFLIKMKVRTALILFLVYNLLGILSIFALQANVAYSTHISALIFGYLYARFFIKTSAQERSI
ncbi:rhomboid family intramembrane serine protease [Candidatus Micrarchaeota archaeon]|nr:rhomboid family intramembrane serine protease [Candidatus Micrarchaeota archaeon]